MKVSIIMTIYNGEDHIKPCIDSILAQTLTDWELIAYDDASTDNTNSILQEYSKNDSRIKVFKGDVNLGIGRGRQEAFKHAIGDYIYIMDGDDTIDSDVLETLYNCAVKNGNDITMGEYWTTSGKKVTKTKQIVVCNTYAEKYLLFLKYAFLNGKLFKKGVLSLDVLSPARLMEDIPTILKSFYVAKRVESIEGAVYHYTYKREGSVTHGTKMFEMMVCSALGLMETFDFLKAHGETPKYGVFAFNHYKKHIKTHKDSATTDFLKESCDKILNYNI